MAKKQDVYYFNNFVACAEESCHAAHLLKDVLANFNPDDLTGRLDEMHAIETRADGRKHEAMDRLAKEFIPPIEREDIITLSQYLDDLTDKIEDVLLRIYMNHVTRIEPAAGRVLGLQEIKEIERADHPDQRAGGGVRPSLYVQHERTAHSVCGPASHYRLEGDLRLSGALRRRL